MKSEIKQKWVEALRSGDYKQTQGWLQDQHGYCCLGVLCDVAVNNNVPLSVHKRNIPGAEGWTVAYDTEEAMLPDKVMEWAGLDVVDPDIEPRDDDDEEYDVECTEFWRTATDCNDSGVMFDRIADLIEANL